MAERLADSPSVDERVFCRACRRDVTEEPEQRGVRTCPQCGRGVRRDGSNSAPRARAECRCVTCGFDVGGIPGPSNTVRCPECGGEMNLLHGPMLEPWSGETAAVKRMLAYTPLGVVCYVAIIIIAVAINFGAPGPGTVWVGLAFCMFLSLGEAAVQARRIVRASVPARERGPEFVRLAGIGVGLSAACWLPVILITAVVLYVL